MIYLSTGGFHENTFLEVAEKLDSSVIKGLELSAGKYTDNLLSDIDKVKKDYSVALHNYFPVPKEPFVFNLASCNREVLLKSMQHAKNAIALSAKYGCPFFSFHAGYLLDPNVNELGQTIKEKKLIDRDIGLDQFIKNVNELSVYAKGLNIELLIENNVLSQANQQSFKSNPLLMVDSVETEKIFNEVNDNVHLLIDVAHLKVSANSLGFSAVDYLNRFKSITRAYHLSDNDGTEDSNKGFDESAWFWKHIRKDLNYYSIEVYDQNIANLQHQYQLVSKCLGLK